MSAAPPKKAGPRTSPSISTPRAAPTTGWAKKAAADTAGGAAAYPRYQSDHAIAVAPIPR